MTCYQVVPVPPVKATRLVSQGVVYGENHVIVVEILCV